MDRAASALLSLAALVLGAGVLHAQGSGGLGAPLDLSEPEWRRLRTGETVTRMIPMAGADQRAGLAVRLVPGDPERVAQAVGDAGHWSEWVPFLKSSGRSKAPGPASRKLYFDLPWPLSDRHYRAELRTEAIRAAGGGAGEAGPLEWTLTWDSVPDSGNVEWARGSFRVTAYDAERSLVVFRSATDVDSPRFARSLLDRVMTDSLRWVLDGLAQQVNRCRYTVPFPAGCAEDRPSRP